MILVWKLLVWELVDAIETERELFTASLHSESQRD